MTVSQDVTSPFLVLSFLICNMRGLDMGHWAALNKTHQVDILLTLSPATLWPSNFLRRLPNWAEGWVLSLCVQTLVSGDLENGIPRTRKSKGEEFPCP